VIRSKLRGLVLYSACGLLFSAAVESADEPPTLPADCARLDFKTTGRPFFFPAQDGVAFGISSVKERFKKGEAISLAVWVNNRTDKEFDFVTCQTLHSWNVDVYDAKGQRLPSRADQQLSSSGQQVAELICFRTFAIPVPPHSCVVPDPPTNIDLNSEYDLPSGRYMITERRRSTDYRQWKRTAPGVGKGVVIQVD
jgi:hypothetical protein